MPTDEEAANVELALRYHRAVADGVTGDDLAAFFSPDVRQHELPNALFPDGAVRDLAGILQAANSGQTAIREQRFDVHNVVAAGDQVGLEVRWTGTLAVDYGPLPAGHVLRADIATFLTIRDGRIVAQRNYDCFERLAP